MKKKIILSLASFVVLCIAIGALSIIRKPVTNADSGAIVPSEAMPMEGDIGDQATLCSSGTVNVPLFWTAYEGAISYSVEKEDTVTATWVEIVTTTELSATDVIETSREERTITYRVTALDTDGDSLASYVGSETISPCVDIIGEDTPENQTASAANGKSSAAKKTTTKTTTAPKTTTTIPRPTTPSTISPTTITPTATESAIPVITPTPAATPVTQAPTQQPTQTSSQTQTTEPAQVTINNFAANQTTPWRTNRRKVTTTTTTPAAATQTTTQTQTTTAANTPSTQTTPVTTPQTTPSVSTSGIQWGAFLPDGTSAALTSFENQVGKAVNIRAVFVGWGQNGEFPSWLSAPLKAANKTLMMYWEPSDGNTANANQPSYNYDSIINGSWDSYITGFANDVKNYGGKVLMVPFEEMNGDWYPWSGTKNSNSPAKHNAAYKHLHDIFVAQGATNAKWGWAPNNDSWPNTSANDLTAYYPGAAYVDYVGVDGFNFNSPWISFSQVFNTALGKLAQYSKPIYIFSMASAEKNDGGAAKAAWITDALTVQIPGHNIAGWIWFNENKEANWLTNSTASVLAAFKAGIQ